MAHGITVSERSSSISVPAQLESSIPVVLGTAPINMSRLGTVPVNVPILVKSFSEAVEAVGYSENFASYSLCEFMDSHFRLYGLSPVILINVLDPSTHKAAVAATDKPVSSGVVKLSEEGILITSIVVKSADGTTTFMKNTDYTAAFDSAGFVVITRKASGTIPANAITLKVSYEKLDPSAVDSADIIGGLDSVTGKQTGLELLNQVYPRFGLVPGLVVAPGYSSDPIVAAVMVAKAGNINGHFKALALTDIPSGTGGVSLYTDAPVWKANNNYTASQQVVTWPKVTFKGKQYHLSTQVAGTIGETAEANGGIPYVSPSNKSLRADGAVIANGSEVFLGPDQAAYLNAQGILTALNFVGGWKTWGNHTGAFPTATEAKDSFIAIRNMFNWIANSIVLTYWKKVDDPLSKRLIETVTDDINIWLNGLTSSGALLGGRVEFNQSENATADLLKGFSRFHLYLTPPGPAQEMHFILEYDPSYLGSTFA
ncbi:phage tail sheath family protein [Paenibacillus sp. NRS-1760]|uniref:phage tail sheath family protein n=1 Tax=Paenibacillus sp. NRS-1760 TaxID=3233902 RepID=UPI003D2D7DBE